MTAQITIIGMGVSPEDLAPRQREIIEAADILVGSQRLLDLFSHLSCQRRIIDNDLEGLYKFIETRMSENKIVVLTSGDPLFFSIGVLLVRRLGARRVQIFPNVSAVAAAFAKLGEPWSETRVVSLHGRDRTGELLRYLSLGETVAVYTDPTHTPAWIAETLLSNALSDISMWVLEELGGPDERVTRITPERARAKTFHDLNLVVLKPDPARQTRSLLFSGMPDDWFSHENGLITKSEIRAISLSRLRLFDRAVFWDLGAGSGSISIEAGQFITRGEIFAVEQSAERIRHIRENRARFCIGNMKAIEARIPDGLTDLPDPDRIFVGGGGEDLEQIIPIVVKRLKPAGIIVINTVLLHNLMAATASLEKLGLEMDTVQVQVNRATAMPFSHRLEALNPVWIISGRKPGPNSQGMLYGQ